MRKVIILLVGLSLFSVGIAIAGGEQEAAAEPDTPAAVQTIEIVVGNQNTASSVIGQTWERMAEIIHADERNLLRVRVFHNAVLGQEREMIEQMIAGTLDMALTSVGNLGVFEPRLNLLGLPFLYEDTDHVRSVVDTDFFEENFNDPLSRDTGIRVLHTGFPGFRYVYTKDQPVRSMEDFEGLKIRIPPSDVHRAVFTALGANPTPMAFGEIYTGLQTGVIEGMENINEYVWEPGLHEQLDYATRTGHMFEPWLVAISEVSWQRLNEDQQELLKSAAVQAWNEQRAAQEERLANYEERLKSAGMEFIEIDRQPMIEATESVRQDLAAQIPNGPALVRQIQNRAN